MTDTILQNAETFKSLLSNIKCNNYEFIIRERNGDCALQIQFDAYDNSSKTLTTMRQICRIWPLQNTMCDSEVIRTAWKAAEAATMHELEEQFTFCDEMIYSPHMNVHKLVELRKQDDIDQIRIPVKGNVLSKFGTSIMEEA